MPAPLPISYFRVPDDLAWSDNVDEVLRQISCIGFWGTVDALAQWLDHRGLLRRKVILSKTEKLLKDSKSPYKTYVRFVFTSGRRLHVLETRDAILIVRRVFEDPDFFA